MERMTAQRMNGIKSGFWSPRTKEDLVQRLGRYEDTGLEPEEIRALRQQAEQDAGPSWIRMDERQPPMGKPVIVARVYEVGAPLRVEQGTLVPGGWIKVFGANTKLRNVPLWMPMPEPPEVEE